MNKPTANAKHRAINVSVIEKLVVFSKKLDLKISEKLICEFICITSKNNIKNNLSKHPTVSIFRN